MTETQTKQKILVIEDQEYSSLLLAKTLSSQFSVLTASDGHSGLMMALEHKPDLIISDIMLPDITGYDILKKIRLDHEIFDTPIILLTVHGAEDNVITGWQLGADDFMIKPFKPQQLISRVNNLIGLRRMRNTQKDKGVTHQDPYLNKLFNFIEQNIDNENLSIKNIADHMGESLSSTERHIKKLTGMSPVKLITKMRLDKARKLIREQPSLSIKEIAYQTGFSSLSYFSKVYKSLFGMQPLTDRKTHVKKPVDVES